MLRKINQQDASRDPANPLPNSTMNSIRKEIAIMKKCRHPHLVRLFEIIDDPNAEKIYMIMEYLSGGPVEWTNANDQPILLLKQTRRILRDVLLGLDYLHHEGVIHRDIKPANILYTKDRRSVKLIDFGVAHFTPPPHRQFIDTDDDAIDPTIFPAEELTKTIGTPTFLAPEVLWFSDDAHNLTPSPSYETFTPSLGDGTSNQAVLTRNATKKRLPITKAIDIWSLGVTFYCFLFGHTPFSIPSASNAYRTEFVLYNQICHEDWTTDQYMGADHVPSGGRHPKHPNREGPGAILLLEQMLQKNPRHRITLPEIKANAWVLKDIENVDEWVRLTSPIGQEEGEQLSTSWVRTARMKFLKLIPGNR
ncbi:hypothetical protein M413DRAFT_446343 [Hebeloma cylindrosporum]|uniref:Protein kinase domain-containing protein n=1 Tax=Hebeloma cylindrosporum TaxID=76867 RepID=A0A0C2YGG3_HEBCY|nr:hypothetical protein M413DRAFT_446343 [Hebeloma cylindrosporum h7]